MPKSIAKAINKILSRVPKPGRSFRGIQSRRTKTLIINVATPIVKLNCFETPSESTVHGELPIFETIRKASPIPNRRSPKVKISNRLSERLQVFSAVQGKTGIDECGLTHWRNRSI